MLQLGLIPSWQFDQNPANNPMLNPHLVMPEGMTQLTVQPVGPYITSGDSNLQGLGVTMARPLPRFVSSLGLPRIEALPRFKSSLGGFFDSGWWANRKWLAFGILGLVGLGVAGVATKVLR